MNKQYVLKSKINGFYFVKGKGYAAALPGAASKVTQAEADAVAIAGFEPFTMIEVATSFAVMYIRPQDLLAGGGVAANKNNPSRRRFATRDEANQHGSRFGKRKAEGSKVEGSAGHIGFYVVETTDPVNASINWKTGLTNSL